MTLKTKINNYPVTIETDKHPKGKVYLITINNESEVFELLGYMLRTVSIKSRFQFCRQETSFSEWLNVYDEIINLK